MQQLAVDSLYGTRELAAVAVSPPQAAALGCRATDQTAQVDSLYVYASAVTALIIIAPDSVHEQTHENAGLESYKSRVCWLGFGGQGRRGSLTRSSCPPSGGSGNGAIALGSLTVMPVQSAFPGLHEMLRLWWTLPSLTFMPPGLPAETAWMHHQRHTSQDHHESTSGSLGCT